MKTREQCEKLYKDAFGSSGEFDTMLFDLFFENTEILCFDRVKFLEIMKEDFELSKIIINSLAIKVRRLYRQGKNSIPIKVEKRVAAKLWKLSRDYGIEIEEGTLIDLNITITYLADIRYQALYPKKMWITINWI